MHYGIRLTFSEHDHKWLTLVWINDDCYVVLSITPSFPFSSIYAAKQCLEDYKSTLDSQPIAATLHVFDFNVNKGEEIN